MSKQKPMTTAGQAQRERIPPTPLSGGIIQTSGPKLDARAYCLRFGSDDDFKQLQKIIEARRSTRPAHTFWACDGCGRRFRLGPDKTEGGPCPFCNIQAYKDGSMLRVMSQREVKIFLEEEAANRKQFLEQSFRSAFYLRNEDRKKQGLVELTPEEYREESRREFILKTRPVAK